MLDQIIAVLVVNSKIVSKNISSKIKLIAKIINNNKL